MSNDRPEFRGHFPLTTRRSQSKKRKKLSKWRYPKGIDRCISESRGPKPSIGYGHKKSEKNKHPSGYYEVYVVSRKDIENIKEKNVAIRFSGKLGKKKKDELIKFANEKNIKILN